MKMKEKLLMIFFLHLALNKFSWLSRLRLGLDCVREFSDECNKLNS